MKKSNSGFKYFGFVLRLLAFFHFLNIASWKYYIHNPALYFKLPVLEFFSEVPPFLHIGIFILFTVSSFLFIFSKKNYIYSFLLSFCFLYYECHDVFSFHHDIFLAINLYFLYGMAQLHYHRKNYSGLKDYIFALKVLCTIIYLFAGIHKLNPYFYSGNLIGDILNSGILNKVSLLNSDIINVFVQPLAILTILGELSIPILLWTRYKKKAVIFGFMLHFGISFFGNRGILFNLYLPAFWILFFTFNHIDISQLSTFWKKIVSGFDFINLSKLNPKKKILPATFKSITNNILFLNPLVFFFMMLYLFKCFEYLKKIILIQFLGFESSSIMEIFK